MARALDCAECPAPAAVLVAHPHLYRMAVPLCGLHGALSAGTDVVPLDSPEGREMLESYTVLRGFVVPRPGGAPGGG